MTIFKNKIPSLVVKGRGGRKRGVEEGIGRGKVKRDGVCRNGEEGKGEGGGKREKKETEEEEGGRRRGGRGEGEEDDLLSTQRVQIELKYEHAESG